MIPSHSQKSIIVNDFELRNARTSARCVSAFLLRFWKLHDHSGNLPRAYTLFFVRFCVSQFELPQIAQIILRF